MAGSDSLTESRPWMWPPGQTQRISLGSRQQS